MPTRRLALLFAVLLFAWLAGCAPRALHKPKEYNLAAMDKATRAAYLQVHAFLQQCITTGDPVRLPKSTRIDTILIYPNIRQLDIKFSRTFAQLPFREENTADIYRAVFRHLRGSFRDYTIVLYALDKPIELLIPNYFRRDSTFYDVTRMPAPQPSPQPMLRNASHPWQPAKGLWGRHIALWPSHGWYFEHRLNRWEWQRARVFQTVEDLLPFAFAIQYLVPMLENAGATVFLPRERDVQTHMIIVDNDSAGVGYLESTKSDDQQWQTASAPGFAIGKLPYTGNVNPFKLGTARLIAADSSETASVSWTPDMPVTGEYAVYIAYQSSPAHVADARYAVFHAGGRTEFVVNQQMGGGTWVYLGTFRFHAGSDSARGRVQLSNSSATPGRLVSADAVRFGGGMGDVARNGQTSGRPRFVEGARYYLQYAGMPDSLVYNVSPPPDDDYRDDYQSRGEWVNFLRGAPFGPNKNRQAPGLNIPIDLSLAFHTDAGVTRNDTTVGTLMIYSSDAADTTRVFPDGVSRFANRDLGDMMQTQIIDDLRARYDPAWNRRDIWDRQYSEALRPNVPGVLLELLSHQNFLDMKFALDPRFRFDASRAIYKAMLRFLALQHRVDVVVQPLPVSHLSAQFTGPRQVTLRWRPVLDPLELSAAPEKFLVYTRRDSAGFDNGRLVDSPVAVFDSLAPGVIYSYKVTALNAGGESFPSEIISVCWLENDRQPVLIVNGFERVAPPAALQAGDLLGFADFWDQGVPDRIDINYIGSQYNFDGNSPWLDDDAPGHGASHADFETLAIPGNSFDFPALHGRSLRAAGYPFVSSSVAAVTAGEVELSDYRLVDLILGEQKTTPWPKPGREPAFTAFPQPLQEQLRRHADAGGRLFVSGAYLGSDLCVEQAKGCADSVFAAEVMKFAFRTNHAARRGEVTSFEPDFLPFGDKITFNTGYDPAIYTVEAPDAIEPATRAAKTLLRYAENNISAAVGFRGKHRVVAFGFPFETILGQSQRDATMAAVLRYLME